jgi:hypothetical protein
LPEAKNRHELFKEAKKIFLVIQKQEWGGGVTRFMSCACVHIDMQVSFTVLFVHQ